MPLPRFVDGEVLSAAKLNALVAAADRAYAIVSSIGDGFQQVQIDAGENAYTNAGVDHTWYWLFKYKPVNRYLRIRYVWSARPASGSRIEGYINGTQKFLDNSGVGTAQWQTIDLQSSSLVDGTINTFQVYVFRSSATYCRVELIFNTNNATYAPTIV